MYGITGLKVGQNAVPHAEILELKPKLDPKYKKKKMEEMHVLGMQQRLKIVIEWLIVQVRGNSFL